MQSFNAKQVAPWGQRQTQPAVLFFTSLMLAVPGSPSLRITDAKLEQRTGAKRGCRKRLSCLYSRGVLSVSHGKVLIDLQVGTFSGLGLLGRTSSAALNIVESSLSNCPPIDLQITLDIEAPRPEASATFGKTPERLTTKFGSQLSEGARPGRV